MLIRTQRIAHLHPYIYQICLGLLHINNYFLIQIYRVCELYSLHLAIYNTQNDVLNVPNDFHINLGMRFFLALRRFLQILMICFNFPGFRHHKHNFEQYKKVPSSSPHVFISSSTKFRYFTHSIERLNSARVRQRRVYVGSTFQRITDM